MSLPIIAVAAACLGLIVGLPSRRLIGDYLAILTLFFGEAFVEFTNNVAPSKLGGPNGIVSIDPIRGFGHQLISNKSYFWFLLALLVLTAAALHLLDTSRTGRAWRAVREDPLAAGMMTIPVNRVKLMAFSFGAVVAALAGTVFAAQQVNVFPTDFDTPFLILIYAALILGGAGSIGGAILGGLLLSVMLDGFLRSPTEAGYLFYGVILLTLIVKLRPWRKLVAVLAATVVFGFVVHAIVEAISKSAVAGQTSSGWISSALHNWVVVPSNPTTAGNIGFVVLLCLVHRADPGQRADEDDSAGADAVPGRVRVGGRARRPAVDHASAPDRRDPDRDDERAAAGAARIQARRGRLNGRHGPTRARARQAVAVVRRAEGADRARPERLRARDRQRHRARTAPARPRCST